MTQAELEETKNYLAKTYLIEHEIVLAHYDDLLGRSEDVVDLLRKMSRDELRDLAKELLGTPASQKWAVIAEACAASDGARPDGGSSLI